MSKIYPSLATPIEVHTDTKVLLEKLISIVKLNNKGLKPYINKAYYCATCGSTSGESHPSTSYCFICDTDNWIKIN